jgi:phosphohistidine phosphatase
MKTLILLRHAKAVRDHEAPSDHERALTGRGKREAALAGQAITAAGLKPDFALVSSAQRTRQTANLALAHIAPLDARVDDRLYHAAPQTIWACAISARAENIIVIGHNPGIHELAAHLTLQAHDRSRAAQDLAQNFPTAAFAAFEIAGETLEAAGPRLLAFWRPERDDRG